MKFNFLVSVRLMTYNHENYILSALENANSQLTSARFEIIIGDDFSTDSTAHLIESYIMSNTTLNELNYLKRGDSYKVKRRKEGRLYNFVNILDNCRGKYIALLDGDDYWIDERKLQKQVDFLEANPRFAICFSPVHIVDQQGQLIEISNQDTLSETTYKDLLKGNYLNTPSVMIRRDALPDQLPEWINKMPMGDWPLLLLASMNGDIKMLNEPLAAYRIHDKGVWSTHTSFQKLLVGFKARRILLAELPKKAHSILLHSIVGNALYISSYYRDNGARVLALRYFLLYLYYRALKWIKK